MLRLTRLLHAVALIVVTLFFSCKKQTTNDGRTEDPSIHTSSLATEFINITLDGIPYNIHAPADSLLAYGGDGPPPVWATSYGIQANKTAAVQFQLHGTTTGPVPVKQLIICISGANYFAAGSDIVANVTEFGSAGGYIAGTFSAIVQHNTAGLKPAIIKFRLRHK